ncbi:MAG: restriction endonuclease subunit S [Anaerolineales bacterium]|nr:restriction endonuclease subunit S [Anaerolineales bacterium]
MKKGWKVERLGDVCEVLDSKRKPITKRDRTAGEYPYYGATGILDYVHEFIFDEKLVLIGEDGAKWESGEYTAFTAEGKYWVNNHAHVIRPNRSVVLDEWIVYFLYVSDLHKYVTGLTVPKLNQEKMRSIEIPLPPLPEQKRIVSLLDECFAALAQVGANAARNLVNAREVFEGELYEAFENKNWDEKKFGEVCGFVRGPFGGSLKKEIFVKDGYAVYEQQHAIYNQFEDIRYFVKESKFKEMQRFEIHPGNLIMSCSGTMGKVAIVPKGVKQGIINQALLLLKPSKHLLNTFIKYWMESRNFQESLRAFSQGAAIQNVASVKILKEISVPFPPLGEQRRIVQRLDELSKETRRLEAAYRQKMEDVEELRKSVLKEAFQT